MEGKLCSSNMFAILNELPAADFVQERFDYIYEEDEFFFLLKIFVCL